MIFFFFSSRRRHTRWTGDWSSDVCSSDLVGGGLHRLFVSRGDETDDLRLRVLCPVSVRSDDQRGSLGNKVSAIFVSLPVGAADPTDRLSEISAQTADLKEK